METVSYTRSGIRASAGSGKTYELTSYYLRSLLRGASPRELLAATFTRKAAGEILGRVLLRLCDACEDPESFETFLNDLGAQKIPFEQGRELLLALCSELHHVRISTIDSFFGQMLRSYCHDLGISAGLKIIEEDAPEAERIRDEAIRQLLSTGDRAKLLQMLNTLESGKARRRISASLSDRFEKAHEYFAMTPHDVWQPKYRMRTQLGETELNELLDALESWVLPEGADKRLLPAAKRGAKDARAEKWEQILKNGIGKILVAGGSQYYSKEIPADLKEIYQSLVEHASGVLLEGHRSKTLALRDALQLYDERYCALREREGVLLFHDVPLLLSRYMADLTPKEIAHRLDSRIDYLLLDEFQDTAPQQYAILRPFAQQIMELPPQKGLLFCVGDLKQSIYGWRGTAPEIFAQMEEEFPQIQWNDSDRSYRSSPVVLSVVNQLFGSLVENAAILAEDNEAARDSAREWAAYFNPHQAVRADLSGYVELLQSPRDEHEEEEEDAADRHLEFAAEKIAEAAREAPHIGIGVLVRRNKTATKMIHLLRKIGVVATGEAGHALSDNPAVALILSAVHFAEHPGDRIALFHLLNSPLAWTLQLRGERVLEPSVAAQKVRRMWHEEGFAFSINSWAKVLAAHCNRESALCLEQLVQLAEQYSKDFSNGEEFIAHAKKQSALSAAQAQVRVMTIHKSKGLEFDAVFLPELEPTISWTERLLVSRDLQTQEINSICLWPNKQLQDIEPSLKEAVSRHARSVIREAFCTLYVAMTRAKRALYMLVPAHKTKKDGKAKKARFSSASIVRAGLCGADSLTDLEPKTVLYTCGDPFWYRGEEPKETEKSSTDSVPSVSPNERKEKTPLNGAGISYTPRNWQRVSPSVFEEGTQRTAADLLRPKKSEAALRGTLIHDLFSRLRWLEPGTVQEPIEAKELERLKQRMSLELSTEAIEDCLQSFQGMLASPINQRWLSRPGTAEGEEVTVWCERRFAVYVGQELIVGQFDRVLVFSRDNKPIRAEIIDFKTGSCHPSRTDSYRTQMALYHKALQKKLALPAEKIRCHLLFVEDGISHEICF